MRILILAVMAFLFAWPAQFGGSANAQQTAPPAASVFGRLPEVIDAALSPDGDKLVLLHTHRGERVVSVMDISNIGQARVLTRADAERNSTLRGVSFIDDDLVQYDLTRTIESSRATLFASYRRPGPQRLWEFSRAFVMQISTKRAAQMMRSLDGGWALVGLSDLVAPIAGDPGFGRMIAPESPTEFSRQVIYRVDLRTGDATARERLERTLFDALFNQRGEAIVRTDANRQTNEWRLSVRDGNGRWRQIKQGTDIFGVPPALLGLFPDGRFGTFKTIAPKGLEALIAIDPATGAEETIFASETHDVSDVTRDPWTRDIVGVNWTDDIFPQQKFFDADLEAARKSAVEKVGGGYVEIVSWSKDRARFLIYAESVIAPTGGYFLFLPATGQLANLGLAYPEAPANAQVQSIRYAARDGARVPAVLSLPIDAPDGPKPTVVLVHGGPASRDSGTFDYWAGFLASRGYVVLQPNFRGSTGFGRAWEEAGHGEWGGRMQTDVEDGVRALIRSRIADPARICIVGASYGGFAALAGAMITPDLYKCAISVNGVSDLPAFLDHRIRTYGQKSMTADYWQTSIGDRNDDQASIRAASPSQNVNKITAPILLLHGTQDSVVPIEQSTRMRDRLRAAGKDVTFVELLGDDHWLSDAATRTKMLEANEAFLAKHLKQ